MIRLMMSCPFNHVLKNQSTVFMFHVEVESHTQGEPTKYKTFLDPQPQIMEYEAIQLIISLQRSYPNLRYHTVHLSASNALPLIRQAKAEGIKLDGGTSWKHGPESVG